MCVCVCGVCVRVRVCVCGREVCSCGMCVCVVRECVVCVVGVVWVWVCVCVRVVCINGVCSASRGGGWCHWMWATRHLSRRAKRAPGGLQRVKLLAHALRLVQSVLVLWGRG